MGLSESVRQRSRVAIPTLSLNASQVCMERSSARGGPNG